MCYPGGSNLERLVTQEKRAKCTCLRPYQELKYVLEPSVTSAPVCCWITPGPGVFRGFGLGYTQF